MDQDNIQLEANLSLLADHFKDSLYSTCRDLLGYKDINHRTHDEMIDVLEDQSCTRKLVVMPRGTFKSSIGVVGYAIWRLMRNPNLRIIIDSELYSNSKNFVREIKTHLSNPMITALFGPAQGPVWGEGEIVVGWRDVNRKEGSVRAAGIEVTLVGQHADLIICDDLNSDNNSRTPEACQKVVDHYRMLTSILDPGGEIVVIGTRYSSADVIGHVLDNEIGESLR